MFDSFCSYVADTDPQGITAGWDFCAKKDDAPDLHFEFDYNTTGCAIACPDAFNGLRDHCKSFYSFAADTSKAK